MIKIAVCDDEKNIRAYLSALIQKQNIEHEIREYASAEEYLSENAEFDLVFLDIEMQAEDTKPAEGKVAGADGADNVRSAEEKVAGLDGMELARRIRSSGQERQPVIIFVTGYEKYVYDAFDVGAFQYLLKPIKEEKFAEVFRRAASGILAQKELENKTLTIQYANQKKVIPLRDIFYIESQNHKVILHTKERSIEYYAKMGELEARLQGTFFRIHKGYLLNLACVDEYNRTEVTVSNGEKLLISKYKYADFVKAHLRFMKQGG